MSLPHPLPETLLRESAWLRTLARRLTGDAGLAEDLQQDVVVAALAQPVQASSGRSWFAGVARNLAAMLRRSRTRERLRLRRLPVPEPAPSPDALAAEAELQQKAVAAVLALPEVYRDTVLLRFMQGLSLLATAQAMGVPEETVRTRQKRALAMLREQLAPEDRERRGLAALLGGLVAWGVAMKSKHAVAVAVVALFALLLVIPFWPVQQAVAPPGQPPAIVPVQAKAGEAAGTQGTEGAADTATTRTEVPVITPPATTGSVTFRLYWLEDRTPVTGVAVRCRHHVDVGTMADTDERGEVTFSGLEPGQYEVGTYDWHDQTATLTAGAHAVVEHGLERGRAVTGTVVDQAGVPVAGALILVSAGGVSPQWLFPAGASDSLGRFSCKGLNNGALVGASHPRHGTCAFRMLVGRSGVEMPEVLLLRLPGGGVSVHGRVVDGTGAAVSHAWVQFGRWHGGIRRDDDGGVWQSPPGRVVATDASGTFTVDCLPEGACPVLVHHRGTAPFRDRITLAAGMQPLQITLLPGGVLTGRVSDAGGNAIAGADVFLDPYEWPWTQGRETAGDGQFRFEDLPPGEIAIEVTAQGLPRQRRTFLIEGTGAQHWDVVLKLEQGIRGRLVDHHGEPMAQWWVFLRGSDRHTPTGTDGRFVLPECEAAANTLVVRDHAGFVPERIRFENVHAAQQEQTFIVTADSAPSARIAGQCVAADGSPLAGVDIQIMQDEWPIDLAGGQCGDDGRFTLGPLPPGRYTLSPSRSQMVFATVDVDLKADDTRDLGQLRAERPARLTLRLLGDPAACKNAEVRLRAGPLRALNDDAGSERVFTCVFPARYRIVVRVGGQDQDAGEVELAAGTDVVREVTVR